jgi:hypothetical protein
MTNSTNAVVQGFARLGLAMVDGQIGVGTTSAAVTGATPRIQGQLARFNKSPVVGNANTGTAMLPSLNTYEQNLPICVVNDTANSLSVYAYVDASGATNAEALNGTTMVLGATTGRIVIATGGFAIFIPIGILSQRGGGDVTNPLAVPDPSAANHANWSAAAFT